LYDGSRDPHVRRCGAGGFWRDPGDRRGSDPALGRDGGAGFDVIDLRSIFPYDWKTISRSILKTGRVLIPGRLRKQVPMDEDQEIILVGLYHRLEVWNPAEWRRYISRTEDKYEQNLSKIFNLL